jgi:hypothetical protein
MKILMVLTSHSALGNTGKKTGFWIEEFAAPYYVFLDAGATITLASPKGGQPPIDPSSDTPENQTPATTRFKADKDLQGLLGKTSLLSTLSSDDYDAIFFPGGHGPLWDLTTDADSINLISHFWSSKKAGSGRLPCARCFIECKRCGRPASGKRKKGNRIYQYRRRSRAAHGGSALFVGG